MTPIVVTASRPSMRVGYSAVGASIVSAVVQRWDGGSGTTDVTSTINFRSGDVPTTGDLDYVRVFVLGVEQAIYLSPLRGRHNDGSVRGVLVQFQYAIPDASPISATVRIGDISGRGTTDLVSFTTKTAESFRQPIGLVITDTAYLCATYLALQPLLPASEQTAEETALYNTQFDLALPLVELQYTQYNRFDGTLGTDSLLATPASYQFVRAYTAAYCRRGDPQLWFLAQRMGAHMWAYYETNTGAVPEQWTPITFDTAIVYLLTGVERWWEVVGIRPLQAGGSSGSGGAQAFYYSDESTAKANHISTSFHTRFNLRMKWSAIGAACIDAKSAALGRAPNFTTELPWMIDSYAALPYNATGLECLDGYTGHRDDLATPPDGSTGQNFQIFTIGLQNQWYLDYYTNFHADSRIPALIKANLDVLIGQLNPIGGGGRGHSYSTDCPNGGGVGRELLPMHAPAAAFCAAIYDSGGSTTYGDLYDDCTLEATVDPISDWVYGANRTKFFGEVFGWTQSGPYYRANGVPTPITTIREPDTY